MIADLQKSRAISRTDGAHFYAGPLATPFVLADSKNEIVYKMGLYSTLPGISRLCYESRRFLC